jgi:hypothetical protein
VKFQLKAIGGMGSEAENDAHAKKLTDLVSAELAVQASSVLIHFELLKHSEVAKNGAIVPANYYSTPITNRS